MLGFMLTPFYHPLCYKWVLLPMHPACPRKDTCAPPLHDPHAPATHASQSARSLSCAASMSCLAAAKSASAALRAAASCASCDSCSSGGGPRRGVWGGGGGQAHLEAGGLQEDGQRPQGSFRVARKYIGGAAMWGRVVRRVRLHSLPAYDNQRSRAPCAPHTAALPRLRASTTRAQFVRRPPWPYAPHPPTRVPGSAQCTQACPVAHLVLLGRRRAAALRGLQLRPQPRQLSSSLVQLGLALRRLGLRGGGGMMMVMVMMTMKTSFRQCR